MNPLTKNLMLAFELPCIHSGHQGGNPIQWLCWGSGSTDALGAKYCHIKACHFDVPLPSASYQEFWWGNTATLVFGFSAGDVCCQAVCIWVTVSNADKICMTPCCFGNAAIDCKGKQHCTASSLCLCVVAWVFREKMAKKERRICPYL